jgi:hypothetical protein
MRVAAGLVAGLLLAPAGAAAADQKQIDAAIKKGTDWLRANHGKHGASHGIGATAMSGLALLEGGVPGGDPAVKAITAAVRDAAPTQTQTYQVALCLMYLDRYGEPGDQPLIQAMAVRLLAGQNPQGGWGYACVRTLSEEEAKALRGLKPAGAGLHPEVEKHAKAVKPPDPSQTTHGTDDNSNTQFAVIAVWLSRKHGVPADWVNGCLDRVERRFLTAQSATSGGWEYMPGREGSPSMHCAGLIALATGVARRDERKKDPPKKEAPKDPAPKDVPDDPFFQPPPKADPKADAGKPPARPLDARDLAVQRGLRGLGAHLAESARLGRGALVLDPKAGYGRHDLYFFWSVERVGVVYGMDKIGGVDWHPAGCRTLVLTQHPDGSWGGNELYGAEANTAFAVLFLCKSNLARDLSGRVQKEATTEMKAGLPAVPEPGPKSGGTAVVPKQDPTAPPLVLPGPAGSEAAVLAAQLLKSSDTDWAAILKRVRDAKGAVNTQALVAAIPRLDADRRREAREALAERLCRMTAATLRGMAKDEDPELRRGAVLAMAMKDDRDHVPDLVAALGDDEDLVIRAARAGLKSLTGEDFGPPTNATAGDKLLAATAWKEWAAKQKK